MSTKAACITCVWVRFPRVAGRVSRGAARVGLSYGVAALVPVNDQLLADGVISPLQRQRTVDTMATIRLVHVEGSNQPSTR